MIVSPILRLPLLCLVDDVHWLDRASVQALAFAARRLRTESVAVVFAARQAEDELAGLPDMAVTGLPYEDARELVRTSMPGTMDEQVLNRFVAETRGNPLALLELPKEANLKYLAGGYGVPDIGALANLLQVSYQRRLEELPERTRRLLLVAAEPGGRPVLLWRAADRLGIGIEVRQARHHLPQAAPARCRAGEPPGRARALTGVPARSWDVQ